MLKKPKIRKGGWTHQTSVITQFGDNGRIRLGTGKGAGVASKFLSKRIKVVVSKSK